jgi:D-amino-acid dehydrogenase
MKILVLGAGVVGTAAAFYLAKDGHEVTVVDRHAIAARGTSYSNAGLVSPGDATAWASPAAL